MSHVVTRGVGSGHVVTRGLSFGSSPPPPGPAKGTVVSRGMGTTNVVTRGMRAGGAALPPDLLSAAVAYLRATPSVATPLTVAGVVQVFDEKAQTGSTRPFLVIRGYTEELPGETAQDELVRVEFTLQANGLDSAVTIGDAVRAALDLPNFNPNSLGRALFAWQGGSENYMVRDATMPRRLPGIGGKSLYVYEDRFRCEFCVNPEQ